MDVTNQHIAFTLQLKLVEAFDKFMKQLVSWTRVDYDYLKNQSNGILDENKIGSLREVACKKT
jgi:hypothetical protein